MMAFRYNQAEKQKKIYHKKTKGIQKKVKYFSQRKSSLAFHLIMHLNQTVPQVNKLCLQFLLKMEINLEELLEFCAYYQLNKHAARLTVETIFQENNKSVPPSPPPKAEKTVRRKIEVVEPKKMDKGEKVAKPKLEVVPKKAQKQVPATAPKQKSKKRQGNEDLTYFLNHMAGNNQETHQKHHEDNWNPLKNYQPLSKTPGEYNVKNYDTFGKGNQGYQYETFQSKIEKQNPQLYQGNRTERYPEPGHLSTKQFKMSDQKNYVSPFEPYQPSRIKKFWETTVYQTRKNDRVDLGNLMYSPVRRQNPSPSQSLIFSQLNDRSMIKSKSKTKRKNSQRPLYNPSHLTSKDRENETRGRKNEYDQSVLSNSYISTEEMRVSNNKKQFDEEGRRQTSTTIYVTKHGKQVKMNPKKDILQNDLDDGMQQVINQIASQQRNAPIAISLVSREAKV